jgi:pimeloyl-ACP methyl ester carboxylesterase
MREWDHIASELSGDFTMVIPDLRGHGRSTNPGNEFDHRRFAQDALELMSSLDYDAFAAIGHSAGAITLLHLSSTAPERVTWQVLIAGAPVIEADHGALLSAWPEPEDLDPTLREFFLREHPGGALQIEQLLDGMRKFGVKRDDINFDAETVGRITAPTLVVWGDRDDARVELALRLYREIPEASLWVLPGMNHFPFWEEWGGSVEARRELIDRIRRRR